MLGIETAGRLDILDIVLYLATIGLTKADDPPHVTTVNKCRVVQDTRPRSERDYSRFTVFEAVVDPHQRGVPVEFPGNRQ